MSLPELFNWLAMFGAFFCFGVLVISWAWIVMD